MHHHSSIYQTLVLSFPNLKTPFIISKLKNMFKSTNMNIDHHSSLLVLLLLLLSASAAALGNGSYVEEACRVTRYRKQCVESLAPFSGVAKRSPSKWARAGVSVTIGEVKAVSRYLGRVKRSRRVWGRTRVAIADCVEVIQDGLDYLHQSLYVLRSLNATEFEGQMNDVLTWLSTVLTDEDTCLEGLEEAMSGRRQRWWRRRTGRIVRVVKKKVTNASYITSNALALVNHLATSGSSTSHS